MDQKSMRIATRYHDGTTSTRPEYSHREQSSSSIRTTKSIYSDCNYNLTLAIHSDRQVFNSLKSRLYACETYILFNVDDI